LSAYEISRRNPGRLGALTPSVLARHKTGLESLICPRVGARRRAKDYNSTFGTHTSITTASAIAGARSTTSSNWPTNAYVCTNRGSGSRSTEVGRASLRRSAPAA